MTDKGKIVAFPDTATIEAEAAAWVARFDAENVSAQEYANFLGWLDRSALHRAAIAEYGNFWAEFDKLRGLGDSLDAEREFGGQRKRAGVFIRSKRWLVACGAAVAVAAVAGSFLYQDLASGPPIRLAYETAVGAQKKVTLPDGSVITLNTNSKLEVEMSRDRRDVRLTRGEAYFEVAHDASRPFTVYAKQGVVRDVGTAFDVRLLENMVDVSVTTGKVEIAAPAPNGEGAAAITRLGVVTAGHDALFGRKIQRAETISDASLDRKLAWRQGVLIYAGQPLAQVLADISRYSDIKVELADPKLRDRPVGGVFRTNQIHAALASLESNFGIHAQWIDARHVRLTSRRSSAAPRD